MLRLRWSRIRCTVNLARSIRTWRSLYSTAGTAVDVRGSIYPPLLEKARQLAAQHDTLSKELESSYDSKIAKKVGELKTIANALQLWQTANESMDELKNLLKDSTTDAELRDLANQDLETTTQQLNEASSILTKSLVPKHPFADLPCLIEIRPGVGGKEAALFASELITMYQSFCASKGLRTYMISHERSDEDANQLISAIIEVSSTGAYGSLRTEAGVHRIQRVPETETKGRTHTSTASVMVLPSFPETNDSDIDVNDPSSDFYIDPKDVRKDVMRASGAGGQHVNKTESAVRLTYLPTKTIAYVQESRSQPENEKRAWNMLRSRIAQARREAKEDELVKMRRNVIGVNQTGRSDKIRTYNFSQQRTTDHRSGITVFGIEGVMTGGVNLEKIMDSVRDWMTGVEVQDLLADSDNTSGAATTKT